jgi:O-antigen/teichoic acid export membrane protein
MADSAPSALSSPIHFRRTGLVVFSARLLSVATGLAFLLMLTRSLTPTDFGLWEFIVDLVAFSSYPAGLIAFWATRKIARGLKLGRTAIGVSLLLSAAGIAFFVVASVYLHSEVGSALSHFVIAAALVPLSYLSVATNAVVSGYRPEAAGYSLVASEIFKVVSAYALLVVLGMGVDGVIATMAVTYLVQSLVNTFMSRGALGPSVDLGEGRRWLVDSWVPALSSLAYTVNIADTFVASIVFAGTLVVGYYQAAFSIATIVTYSGYLATALYPMLLGGGSEGLPSVALDFTLLFGIPMAVGASVLARPLLFLLKPVYAEGQTALIILSFASLVYAVSGVVDYTLLGTERVDAGGGAAAGDYAKSNLTFVPIVNFVSSVAYLALIFLLLSRYSSAPLPVILELWASGQLVILFASVLVKARRAARGSALRLPRNLPLYTLASAVMGLFSYSLSRFISYTSRSLLLGAELVLVVASSGALYFLLMYALDSQFRSLVGRFIGRHK